MSTDGTVQRLWAENGYGRNVKGSFIPLDRCKC